MTEEMKPFRDLLKPSIPFYWDNHLQKLFEISKNCIIGEIEKGIVIFDKSRKTCLYTDWSKDGIGFWLLQKHCQCLGDLPNCCKSGWKIAFAGSRFTHPTESRYAPIEGETLVVADSLEKAKHFILGCHDLIVAVDHKPLVRLLVDRKLEDIANPRLRTLKEKTLPFKFKIIHIPGKLHKAPDAISRHPTVSRHPQKLFLPDDIYTVAASSLNAFHSVTWNHVREETTSDPIMRLLQETIEAGFPDHKDNVPQQIREYHKNAPISQLPRSEHQDVTSDDRIWSCH